MRTAILSDVHSNLQALEACVDHARAQGAERFICLGDCVGYGAEPDATLALLRALPGFFAVKGNHDQYLFDPPDDATPEPVQAVIDWTRGQLGAAELEFLRGLPELVRENGATFVHASADAPGQWTYIRYADEVRACMNAAGTPLTFVGHVHVPALFCESDSRIQHVDPRPGMTIPLSAQRRYVVNVGSVGQPRDGNGAACYVLFDAASAEVTFHRVNYDYFTAARKIREAGLPDFFAARLALGF